MIEFILLLKNHMVEFFTTLRDSIVDLLHKGWLDSREIVIGITIILVFDVFLLTRMNTAKRKYINSQHDEWSGEDNKRYVEYYKKKQYIQTIRWIMWVIIVMSFILYHNPNIFAGLAIAVWAFVIAFGSVFVSLALYLYLIAYYSPGQSIKIGQVIGEIVSITPLYLKILGKNESGEHTWELINIPNHQLLHNQIFLIDLDLVSTQKNTITIVYDHEVYNLPFEQFNEQLKAFLDNLFPINTLSMSDHYKSYKWYKYKLTYDINEKGKTLISLGFLCKRSQSYNYRYKIIWFLENTKISETKREEA